jgi:trans-AT polyketide synthase/acyltransferase/oxidoreductase domain-containing protein
MEISQEGHRMQAVLFHGQGAQYKGMGKDVFPACPEYVETASQVLGYSLRDLCLEDPMNRLRLTQYTQPALYVVNALEHFKLVEASGGVRSDYYAGHSLGEFNALLAAGAFDFQTGLRLVQKRGELMGAANGGGMAAILGPRIEEVVHCLKEWRLDDIDVANLNTPTQHVIAGTAAAIAEAAKKFSSLPDTRCAPLNVSAAFHSRHMLPAQGVFAEFMRSISFNALTTHVIANATARPYEQGQVAQTLASQIAGTVRWAESIRYLMGQGVEAFIEVGNNGKNFGGNVLTKMVEEIKKKEVQLFGESRNDTMHARRA